MPRFTVNVLRERNDKLLASALPLKGRFEPLAGFTKTG
jgi:hypothetical protein